MPRPSFQLGERSNLGPLHGLGIPTTTRASGCTVKDHEGYWQTMPANCPLRKGARFGENQARADTDVVFNTDEPVTDATVYGAGYTTKVDGNIVQFSEGLNPTFGNWGCLRWGMLTAGTVGLRKAAARIFLRGTGTITLYLNGGGFTAQDYRTVTLTEEGKTITVSIEFSSDPTWGPFLYMGRMPQNTAEEVYVTGVQIKNTTGQANQNPSEYVSVGVLSAPYHGLGVDGIKAFDNENGNTVSDGVVTEAFGVALDPRPVWEHMPPATNYADGDDDLSGGAETIDLTTPGTGDYTLSVYGTAAVTVAAGTATGTGFGQATEGTDVTFNISVAGTITLTLDSGILDTHDGAATKQVEKSVFSTNFIPTSGGSASTTTPAHKYQLSGNVDETELSLVVKGWVPKISAADHTVNQGMVGIYEGSIFSILYVNSSAAIVSYDGTAFPNIVPSFVAGNKYNIFVRASATKGKFRLGYRDVTGSGSAVWGTEFNFDGDYPTLGLFIHLFLNNIYPQTYEDVLIWEQDLGEEFFEANY